MRRAWFAAAAFAAAACGGAEVPLYLYAGGPAPAVTVEAETDTAYAVGDLVSVAGPWQAGGTAAGAILSCAVRDPKPGKDNLLAEAPVEVRYFYLDRWPPAAPPADTLAWARARGLVADAGLYAYGYIMRPDEVAAAAAPAVDEAMWRAALADLRRDIKKVKLNLITTAPHWPHNKGYKIVAEPSTAAFAVVYADYDRGLAVVQARLERLPPQGSDNLFRYLDVYLAVDAATADVKWAAACVGGFALE